MNMQNHYTYFTDTTPPAATVSPGGARTPLSISQSASPLVSHRPPQNVRPAPASTNFVEFPTIGMHPGTEYLTRLYAFVNYS
jgi:hypothetical protein